MNLSKLFSPWRNFISAKQITEEEKNDQQKEIITAGNILKEKRIKLGLTRNELAVKTRITAPIIEAIENGWDYKFPEDPYLITMLSHLES